MRVFGSASMRNTVCVRRERKTIRDGTRHRARHRGWQSPAQPSAEMEPARRSQGSVGVDGRLTQASAGSKSTSRASPARNCRKLSCRRTESPVSQSASGNYDVTWKSLTDSPIHRQPVSRSHVRRTGIVRRSTARQLNGAMFQVPAQTAYPRLVHGDGPLSQSSRGGRGVDKPNGRLDGRRARAADPRALPVSAGRPSLPESAFSTACPPPL